MSGAETLRVLVVEDDVLIREMMRDILVRAGYDVRTAAHGREGLASFEEWPDAIVITDLVMPEIEGLELIRRVRRANPDARIIAMSGGGRVGSGCYLRLASAMGAAHTIKKPFVRRELLEAVTAVAA